ncbi:hypothetical protein Tco_1411798 [Tanacetum coccineum]
MVKSYNSDKYILTSYGDVVTLKRGRDDQDKDEDPSAGSNRGSKRRRSGKEAESSKEPTHRESKSISSSKGAFRSQPKSSGKSAYAEEHSQKVDDLEDQPHQEFDTGNDDVAPVKEPFPLILNERGCQVIPLDHFINNDLEYHKEGCSSKKYTTSITKKKAADYGQVKWIKDKVSRIWSLHEIIKRRLLQTHDYCSNQSQDHAIFLVTVIWKRLLFEDRTINYTSLEKATSKDFVDKTLKICYFSLRNVIQERVKDLQLRFESYQKKINLTKPNIYRPDLRKMTPYTAYPDIQGFIYEDDMNRNCLMRIDELHKFSDGTLNHVRTALNDIAAWLEINYLPKME